MCDQVCLGDCDVQEPIDDDVVMHLDESKICGCAEVMRTFRCDGDGV